jgi:hypothetical protein
VADRCEVVVTFQHVSILEVFVLWVASVNEGPLPV